MMESLPPEMLLEITQNLTAQALSACCSVSLGWRDIFSHDALWKPHCDPSLEEYLRTTPCTVEPGFVSPEGEDSTLSPVGRWRLAFMRENHLWNNWQQGNYRRDKIQVLPIRYDGIKFLGNDNVLLINENQSINLFNLVTMKEKRSCLRELRFTHFISGNNNFGLLISSSGVQVVFVHEKTSDLVVKLTFFFDETEKLISNSVDEFERRLNEKFSKEDQWKSKGLCAVVGSVFAGCVPEDSILHIWDLETGSKMKTENLSFIGDYRLGSIKQSLSSEFIVLIFRNNENYRVVYAAYNLKQLSFLPFRHLTLSESPLPERDCAIYKHYIALNQYNEDSHMYNLNVYNCFSTDLIYSCPSSVTPVGIIDNCFVIRNKMWMHAHNPTNKRCSKMCHTYSYKDIINQKFLQFGSDSEKNDLSLLIRRASVFNEIRIRDYYDLEDSQFIVINHTSTRCLRRYRDDDNFTLIVDCFW